MGVKNALDDFYNEFCELAKQKDSTIVEEGPLIISRYLKNKDILPMLKPKPARDKYTRNVIIEGHKKPVFIVMEWPAGFRIMPHKHHGRPCFEYVLEGEIVSTEFTEQKIGEYYELRKLCTKIFAKGTLSVLDPRKTDIHSIYSPVRSITLNIYPCTEYKTTGFVLDYNTGKYIKKEFELTKD